MVSNVTIDRLCAHLTNYRGCFSLDQIFGIKREVYKAPSSFVINTFESKYVNGGHWLLATLWGDHIEIFDSLGRENEIPKKIIILNFQPMIEYIDKKDQEGPFFR